MGGAALAAACGSTAPTPAPKAADKPAAPAPAAAQPTTPAKPTEAPKPADKPAAAETKPAAPAAAAPAAATKGGKVHLLNWSSFVPAEDQWLKEKLPNEWGKPRGTEVTVELVGGNDVQPKVVAALQAGAGPDVMLMQWTWPHLYADKLADVGDVAEKAGADGGGWYEVSKQNAHVQGKWRAVPWGVVGNAIAYRESALKQAGQSQFPTDWDTLSKVGADVRKASGLFYGQAVGHSFGDPPTFIFPYLWSYGGSETDETGKKVTINSPESEAALVSFKKLFDAISDPQCLSWDDSANNRSYLANQIWATLNGASIYVAAQKQAQDIAQDTQHALLPRGPKGQIILSYPLSFAVPAYVKDPSAAKDMLAWLMTTKTYGEWMKPGDGYTAAPFKKGETEIWPSKDPKMDPYKQNGALSKWYGYPAPPSAAAAESGSKYITVDMFAKVAQGESPKSAMTWAESELKKVYKV